MIPEETPDGGALPVGLVARALRSRWRAVLVATAALAVAAGVVSVLRARRYEASLSVATVGANRGTTLGQGISAAFLSVANAGLQATPSLIARLLNSNTVAAAVARSHPRDNGPRNIAQMLDPGLDDGATELQLVRAVHRVSSVDVDRETGLIRISVALADSALARVIVRDLADEATALFQVAARAQAREIRVALEARVDSARRQMSSAEDTLVAFASSNRSSSPFSRVAVEQQQLERQVTIAQGVLVQALQEREAAIGKELEETPVLVVVEPLPTELPRVARGTLLWITIGAFLGLCCSSAWAVRGQLGEERMSGRMPRS